MKKRPLRAGAFKLQFQLTVSEGIASAAKIQGGTMISPYSVLAQQLYAQRLNPLPIKPGTKRPALLGWQRFCSEEMPSCLVAKFTKSSIAYGVGLALGYRGVIGIDVDTDDTAQIRAVISVLPPIRAAKRGRRGFTVFFQDPTGVVQTARLRLVEILARGAQTVMRLCAP